MAKNPCASCMTKSGKRLCPALKALICPVCCGEKRLIELRCPSDCRYLQNVPYQEMKAFEVLKKTWFPEHYFKIMEEHDLFDTVTAIEKIIVAYEEQKAKLGRSQTLKGLHFLRRSSSPIEHLEAKPSEFEKYLKGSLSAFKEMPEMREKLTPALDYLIMRLEEDIVEEEKFSEYKTFLKGFFRKQGLDLKEDIKIPEEEVQPDTPGRIIVP